VNSNTHMVLIAVMVSGEQVDAGGSDGVTPLHTVCLHGDVVTAGLLIAQGADVNGIDTL
jgi:ankyrin repeat protein